MRPLTTHSTIHLCVVRRLLHDRLSPAEDLLTARPNPEASETKIVYRLRGDLPIDLQLFDALGRSVMKLAHGDETIGVHEVSLNTEGLAPGIYYARLVRGGLVQSVKVAIVK